MPFHLGPWEIGLILIVLVIALIVLRVAKKGTHRTMTEQIPRRILDVLTEDEVIEKSFDLKDCQIYATDKRLLEVTGQAIRDYDYTHISSVAYTSKRYWWLIVLGIVLMVVGVIASNVVGTDERMAIVTVGVIIGLILIVIGAVKKSEWVETNVVGVPKSVKYKGERQDLDSLLQIIRQKRTTKPDIGKTETKSTDFADTIRKLADLRNEGVITEEEFEEKKSKLLRNSD